MMEETARPARPWARLGLAALILYVLVATAAGWTPSHYAQGARLLGLDVKPIAGEARPARSDDWGVTTPYFQIAVAGDFGPRDAASPYGEPLKAFFALPSRDWSMVFKPDLWGFLALDPANAYALHYALLAASALLGAYAVLRQLGCRGETAAAGSALLFFSQFTQVWWSSNAPLLGMAYWPAAAILWRGPWYLRLPAIAYASAAWLVGELYPPLVMATALGLGFAVAALRPEALRPTRFVPALAAVGVGLGLAWLHYADLIHLMEATAYPGRRLSNGGGVPLAQLFAHLFPHLATQRYAPLAGLPGNACEIAVAGSFLPLAMACFCEGAGLRDWAGRHGRAIAVWAAGLGLMLIWMLAPIPAEMAPFLNRMAPGRMVWAFGLLLTIGLVVAADAQAWRISGRRVAAFVLAVLGAWAVSKLILDRTPVELDRFDPVVILVLGGLLLARRFAPEALGERRTALLATVLASVVTFGAFNPIQPAGPIFKPQASPGLDALAAYARANPKGVVVAPGLYAATLNGVGVRAVNHTLLQPDVGFFARAYPELGPAGAQAIFNRYAHVMPALVWAPSLVQEDLVAIPPDPFAIPLPVAAGAVVATTGAGAVETATVRPLGAGRWGLLLGGWADWRGVSPDQALGLELAPGAGRIVSVSAHRLPRPDLATRRGPDWFAAGFGVRAVVETADGAAPRAAQVRLVAVDKAGAKGVVLPAEITAETPAQVIWPTAP